MMKRKHKKVFFKDSHQYLVLPPEIKDLVDRDGIIYGSQNDKLYIVLGGNKALDYFNMQLNSAVQSMLNLKIDKCHCRPEQGEACGACPREKFSVLS